MKVTNLKPFIIKKRFLKKMEVMAEKEFKTAYQKEMQIGAFMFGVKRAIEELKREEYKNGFKNK